MTTNVVLLHYNNYFNRIVKRLDTVTEYKDADTTISGQETTAHYKECANINFNPNDGVDTSVILGFGTNPSTLYNEGDNFDYLIVYDSEDENNPILSRWFIMNSTRLRNGQYTFELKRDVIADNYNTVDNCIAYVEKGALEPGNPLLFNREGLDVNQIKEKEILLKDKTEVPWIVAYISKNAEVNTPITINYSPARKDYIELSAQTIQDWSYYQYQSEKFYGPVTVSQYRINWQSGTNDNWHYGHIKTVFDNYGNMTCGSISNDDWNYILRANNTGRDAMTIVSNSLSTAWNAIGPAAFNQAVQEHYGAHTNSEVSSFLDYNGKIVKTQDGKFYEIRVFSVAGLNLNESTVDNFTSASPLFTRVKQAIVNSGEFNSSYNTPNNRSLFLTAVANAYSLSYTEVEGKTVKAKISENRRKTADALYDIICLPYGDLNVYNKTGTRLLTTNKEVSMAAINALTTQLGGGTDTSAVYDVQLLPYCPLQASINLENNHFFVDTTEVGSSFDYIVDESTDPDTNVGLVLYVPQSSFTFNISQPLNIERYEMITSIRDVFEFTLIQSGVEFIFKTFDTTWTSLLGTYAVSSNFYSRYFNNIRVQRVNKRTGKIMEDFNCASLEVEITENNENNKLKIYTANTRGDKILKETITNSQYINSDFYLLWTMNQSGWYISDADTNRLFVDIDGYPVKTAAITEQYAIKLNNECKLYRLVSPNYQGEFEFSVAKNLGINEFNVDCTYKPYQPYIHVNPDFKNLYGQDFNDSRGLVCNGDFSFGMVSNAFANYELQNKNYQAIFNRQIQNMDVNNAIARQEAGWQIAAGTVQGAASGALTGAMVGGGYGAIAGAAIGGITSLAGGIADYQNLDKRQTEQKNFTTDMYKLSLQNVQALPNSLTKCSALTYNNKLFPFIEIYGCTTEEELTFIKKLDYDGMTVNVIGRLGDYKGGLVRGEVIRFSPTDTNPLKADTHIANAIYTEIKKGVYM